MTTWIFLHNSVHTRSKDRDRPGPKHLWTGTTEIEGIQDWDWNGPTHLWTGPTEDQRTDLGQSRVSKFGPVGPSHPKVGPARANPATAIIMAITMTTIRISTRIQSNVSATRKMGIFDGVFEEEMGGYSEKIKAKQRGQKSINGVRIWGVIRHRMFLVFSGYALLWESDWLRLVILNISFIAVSHHKKEQNYTRSSQYM